MGRVEFGASEVDGEFVPYIEIKFELESGKQESIIFSSNIQLPSREETYDFLKVIFRILQSSPQNLKEDPNGNLNQEH